MGNGDSVRRLIRAALLGSLGGVSIAASFLDFRLGPLAWLAFTPILVSFAWTRSTREACVVGFVVGLAVNVPAFHWLVGTIHRFGGFPYAVSLVFYGLLSLFGAVQFVLLGLVVRRVGFGFAALAPPCAWIALELLFPNLFPWRLANSQIEYPVWMQVGELTGPFGTSFVMVWLAAAVARRLVDRAGAGAILAALLAVVAVGTFGRLRLDAVDRQVSEAPVVRVGLVQGNLSLEEKGNVAYFESNVGTYRRLSLELTPEPDVVIWPESVIAQAVPRDLERVSRGSLIRLGVERPLLVGALTYAGRGEDARFYNSVLGIAPDGRILGMSDKQILMPFGEFLPFASIFPSLREWSPQTGDFEAGTEVVPIDVDGVGRFAPLNCYEDLRAAISRDAVRRLGADVLFAVANDAWFGDTAAPRQHEALAAWRAVETRRALVRVTNTGVTDVIEPSGRVTLRLPVFREAAAVTSVPLLDLETFYVARGPIFAWIATGLAVAFIVAGRRRRSGRPTPPRSRAP